MGSVLNLFKKVIKILLTVVVGFITPTAVVFALLMFAADEPFWGVLLCSGYYSRYLDQEKKTLSHCIHLLAFADGSDCGRAMGH